MNIEGAFLYQNSLCFTSRKRNPNLRVQPAITTFFLSQVKGTHIEQRGLRPQHYTFDQDEELFLLKIMKKIAPSWIFEVSVFFYCYDYCFASWIIYLEREIAVSTVSMQAFLSTSLLLFILLPFGPSCAASGPLQSGQHLLQCLCPRHTSLKTVLYTLQLLEEPSGLSAATKISKILWEIFIKACSSWIGFQGKKYCLLSQRRKINSIALCHQADQTLRQFKNLIPRSTLLWPHFIFKNLRFSHQSPIQTHVTLCFSFFSIHVVMITRHMTLEPAQNLWCCLE